MYDLGVTRRMVDAQSAKQGWELRYHTAAQIAHAIAHFNTLYDQENKKLTRALTVDEQRFIQNERKLCALDFRGYWLTRYAKIVNWAKEPVYFVPNVAQNIILDLWAEDEARGVAIWMQQLKARRLGVCLDPSTRILTSDLRWVAIEDVHVGDELVGVEEMPRTGRGAGRKMLPTVVEAKREIRDIAFDIQLDNGEHVIATGLHRFLYQRSGAFALKWTQVRRMRVGDKIKTLCQPWGPPNIEDGWIAGMLDGEGSLSVKSGGAEVNISQRLSPVYDRVVAYMKDRGYNYREEFDLREFKAVHPAAPKTRRQPIGKVCVARMREMFRLVGQTRPTRFINRQWWVGKELPGKKVSDGWARIVSITSLGERRMIDLQTSEQTFIAEGFVSHNSTISELNICHRYQFQPYANCVVASGDPDRSIEMAGMIKFALDQQPFWLRPTVTKVKRNIPVEFGEMHSTLSIEAGNQFAAVSRGSAPNIIHLSELIEWQDADELIDGGLLPAVIDDANVFGILESTGGVGWWQDKWIQVKRDFARGTGRIRPVFLPWYVGTDIYPSPADLRKRPIPANWIPSDRTVQHAERAREYVLSEPLMLKHLAKGNREWRMPREQMWWREIGYQTAQEEKKLHIFLAEYCADDFEAFQVQQNPLIDQEILIAYQERTRQPVGVYTIIGPDIPPALVANRRQWDSSKPTITINTRDVMPHFDVKYQLIPLIFEGYSSFDEQLKLLVWEWPQAPYVYGVGVDTSEGVGQDNAVIEVLREAITTREPGQVAEWAANSVTAFQLWPLVCALGCLYSTVVPSVGQRRQCRLAIETWTNGAACQYELQKRGWSNFHEHYYAGDARKPKRPGDVGAIGVRTNVTLRAAIQDLWLTCLTEEAIDLPSPYLVNEITTLENVGGKAQAILGKHDDRWMGLGFPLYSLHRNKPPTKQFQRRRVSYAPGLVEDAGVAHPVWTPPSQGSSRPFAGRVTQPVQGSLREIARHGALGRIINRTLPPGFQ